MPGWDVCDRHAHPCALDARAAHSGTKANPARQYAGLPAPRNLRRSLESRRRQIHRQIPRRSRPQRARPRIDVEIYANSGSCINGQDDKPRVVNYSYVIPYNVNGEVDDSRAGEADWLSVSGEALFAPLNVLEVVQSWWQGHNPYVTEANVRALDLANGGGGAKTRFLAASGPPKFMSVAQYEAGRPSFFGNGGMQRRGLFGSQPDMSNAQPRRGLFRFLGNR